MNQHLRNAVIGAVLASTFTAIAWMLAGASLGLLLAGVFAAIVLIPLLDSAACGVADQSSLEDSPLADSHLVQLHHYRWHHSRNIVPVAIIHSVALVWLFASGLSELKFSECLLAYAVLLSISLLAFALCLMRTNSSLIAITMIAWFTSPVWLGNAMVAAHGADIASVITRYHPLFALNRVVIAQGAWTSGGIAYRHLTPLGQDVAYVLPESILPCVLAHLTPAAGCALTAAGLAWRRRRSIARC